jgi:hypothetical protein
MPVNGVECSSFPVLPAFRTHKTRSHSLFGRTLGGPSALECLEEALIVLCGKVCSEADAGAGKAGGRRDRKPRYSNRKRRKLGLGAAAVQAPEEEEEK